MAKKTTTQAEPPREASARKPMSLFLDATAYNRLRKLSFDRHQPMTELMAEAIERMLKSEKY